MPEPCQAGRAPRELVHGELPGRLSDHSSVGVVLDVEPHFAEKVLPAPEHIASMLTRALRMLHGLEHRNSQRRGWRTQQPPSDPRPLRSHAPTAVQAWSQDGHQIA